MNTPRRMLLGPPLALVLLFYLGFIVIYPHPSPPAHSLTLSSHTPPQTTKPAPLHVAPVPAAAQADLGNAAVQNPASGSTTNPQSPGKATTNIQGAPANQPTVAGTQLKSDEQESSQSQPVTVPLPILNNILNNLFSGNKDK